MPHYRIAPSLLSADFARLGEEANAVLKAGGDILHLDVMDNHYVQNLTVGPLVCEALRHYGIKAPIDVHLMTQPVDRLIVDFAKAGANYITFHPECSENVGQSLDLIHQYHCKAGLALNPETPLDCLEEFLDKIDIILIMSVNPGFGGQQFIPSVLEKLKKARDLITQSGREIRLSIDGGIKVENILSIAKAGADTFVAGSAIFKQPDYATIIHSMRQELEKANRVN
ncbi:MAG TPA: ribulose-phosphate 3-epimerase [Gammaproteobacteria bacterium]|nr:ribulose-phosphate 3-epimerase [Gammaproteobacteria bacterium]